MGQEELGHMESKTFTSDKCIVATGAYVNHILYLPYGVSLDLDVWEMVLRILLCGLHFDVRR